MTQRTILIVEDDARVRALLRNVLEGEGYGVIEAATAAETLDLVANAPVSLVTLDLHLGRDNGLDLARELRKVSSVPIIMVTGQDTVIDRVVGLEIGADDYITKPFHVREVVARVRSVLRRAAPQSEAPETRAAAEALTFDGLTAHPDRMELTDRAGADCGLTTGDFRLLKVFLDSPKRVLSREQLMDLTGGIERNPLDRTIDNQVARLRKKIERNPSDPKLIKTVRGVGYMFVAEVRPVQSGGSPCKSA